jgi:hypothetical protein
VRRDGKAAGNSLHKIGAGEAKYLAKQMRGRRRQVSYLGECRGNAGKEMKEAGVGKGRGRFRSGAR